MLKTESNLKICFWLGIKFFKLKKKCKIVWVESFLTLEKFLLKCYEKNQRKLFFLDPSFFELFKIFQKKKLHQKDVLQNFFWSKYSLKSILYLWRIIFTQGFSLTKASLITESLILCLLLQFDSSFFCLIWALDLVILRSVYLFSKFDFFSKRIVNV